MEKLQSTLPAPDPFESCRDVVSADCKSCSVWSGTNGPPDQVAESTATLTECVSARSTSVKSRVCVGVVSGVVEPVMLTCSATPSDCGPLVIVTGSLEPVMTSSTVWVALLEASLTFTL